MSIIENIKDYLSDCPLLSGKEININYLPHNPGSFAIDNLDINPVVKRYVSGETVRQFCFLLSGRIVYDGDTEENLSVSNFFEEFEGWIEAQNNSKILPEMDSRQDTAISLEITKSGVLRDTARTSARMEIELRLLYKRNN